MFAPYKLVLGEKKPVLLEISVKNTGRAPKLLSIVVEVPYEISLNSGGYVRRREQRLGELKPGEEKKVSFNVFAKPTTLPGSYEIRVTVLEHMDSYDYVAGETTKRVRLQVV